MMEKYWKRILLAGIGVELIYAIYVYYLATTPLVGYAPQGLAIVFVLFALGGWWCGRGVKDASPLLAGVLVGVVGTLFYYALQIEDILAGEQTFPAMAFVNHGLKLAGGAVGGVAAAMLARRGG